MSKAEGYDAIIIGAGSAGCVLAARLSENPGRRVLLLEAGPDYPTRQGLPTDIADGTRLPSEVGECHDWGFASRPSDPDRPAVPLPRGRLVGGSSAVNGTFALRGAPEGYDGWAAAGNPGWGFDEVLPVFRGLERDLDFGERPWHGDSGPVPIRRYPPGEQSVVARRFLDAAERAGHPAIPDHNEPGAVGAGPLPVNTLDRLRMSAALTYLEPARFRPNLTVRAESLVDRIRIRGGRAVGVVLAGGECIDGALVVLSGGAYASPAVLLRSGVGPVEAAAGHGIAPVADLPGVGRNLVDHPLLAVAVAVPREPVLRPHYQTMITWCSAGSGGLADLHLFAWGPSPLPNDPPDHQKLCVNVGLLAPQSRGEVRLMSTNPRAAPHIDPGFLRETVDVERFAVGVREARRILATEPLASHGIGRELPPLGDVPDAGLTAMLPRLVRTYHHPVGTCRMGPDPERGAVVDARGRLHGVDNLIVADASIMPDVPRANTNLPTMMLAERIAGWLTGRDDRAADTTA